MKYSFTTRQQHTEWPDLVDFWREADRIDVYEAGWAFDHFYPVYGAGKISTMGNEPGPVLEGWTMLAALSSIVKRLRLGVLVTAVTYRHPAVLANMAATLDVISGGRLEIGLGTGWAEDEHTTYDIPFPSLKERFDRLEEACEILDALFRNDTTDFEGPFHVLRGARCDPKPLQKPRPPITIGGVGEKRTLAIVARWADRWNLPGGDPAALGHKLAVLHGHCADLGRDPAEIEVSVKVDADRDPAELADLAPEYGAAGADHLILQFSAPFDPAALGTIAGRL